MNSEVMFSKKTDLWETPQYLFDELNDKFHFDLDVCANKENAKCKAYYSKEKGQDGLQCPWIGNVWCNPPYGREIRKWVKKANYTAQMGETVVMLLPVRTDTKWFHDYIYKKKNVKIIFLNKRLKFGSSNNFAPFPSMIVIFESRMKDLVENMIHKSQDIEV